MLVYPEMESWNEFYPSEIFVRAGDTDDIVPPFKKANIGATVYLSGSEDDTLIYKKIGDIENVADIASNTVLIGHVNSSL